MIKYFISGIFVKLLAGFDDTMVHIPVISALAKTKKGKLSFLLGIFIAITIVISISLLFARLINYFPYTNYISSILILLLAIMVYFEKFEKKPKEKAKRKIQKLKFSRKRFFKLLLTGFLLAFATIIDDIIVYSSLFSNNLNYSLFIIAGIFIGVLIQLLAIFYFSKQFAKIPYKKHITLIGLIFLSILIWFKKI